AKDQEAVAAFNKAQTDDARYLCMRDMYNELGTCLELAKPLPPISPVLQEGWESFRRDLPQLLKEKRGWWVLYHGAKRLAFDKDDHALYQMCEDRGWPVDEVGIWCIEPQPAVGHIG